MAENTVLRVTGTYELLHLNKTEAKDFRSRFDRMGISAIHRDLRFKLLLFYIIRES